MMHLLSSALEESATARDEQGGSLEQCRRFRIVWVFNQVEYMSSCMTGSEQYFHAQPTNLERVASGDLVGHFGDSVIT